MCGIIGYVGPRECRDMLLEGLRRLEYRGYDSAGVSLIGDDAIASVHAVGNLQKLRDAVAAGNGIVENWSELRERLLAEGAEFTSETDAEVVAHLIAQHLNGDLTEAVRRAYNDLRGHYAFVAMSADHPDVLVGARKECPLVVGLGDGESFIASAIPAFLAETRNVQLVQDGEIVEITAEGSRFLEPVTGRPIGRAVEDVEWDDEAAEKGGYETFMLKEIHEQADAVAETLADRLHPEGVDLGDIGISDDFLRGVRRIVIVACGTSYHAGLVGRYSIETWSRVPVEMDVASEFRYRNPLIDKDDLVIGISQSGETADTLAAMRLARERGAKVLAITNIMGSQATRDADGVIFTRAGLEIGVAATKTFLAQMIEEVDEPVQRIAEHWKDRGFCLYLGRHVGLAICLEGALKLKEISYIPTDAYAAGEMKHGPIALLSEDTPVVCVATDSPVLDKVMSNVAEVQARGAHVVAVATEGTHVDAEEVIKVPRTDWLLQPVLSIVPLQLLAYHIARERGLNVDQPRNLAKTVTVE